MVYFRLLRTRETYLKLLHHWDICISPAASHPKHLRVNNLQLRDWLIPALKRIFISIVRNYLPTETIIARTWSLIWLSMSSTNDSQIDVSFCFPSLRCKANNWDNRWNGNRFIPHEFSVILLKLQCSEWFIFLTRSLTWHISWAIYPLLRKKFNLSAVLSAKEKTATWCTDSSLKLRKWKGVEHKQRADITDYQ